MFSFVLYRDMSLVGHEGGVSEPELARDDDLVHEGRPGIRSMQRHPSHPVSRETCHAVGREEDQSYARQTGYERGIKKRPTNLLKVWHILHIPVSRS